MKITVYIATSANGFISNRKNVPDWLSPEYGAGFEEICQRTKAVIMGKTTYDILAPDYLPLTNDGITVVLTSNTAHTSGNPTVLFTDKRAREIISMLENKGHNEAVIIGGALTMTEFFDASLVDEIILVVEPVLFGTGLPLFKNSEMDSRLMLVDVKKLNENTVILHYKVQKES